MKFRTEIELPRAVFALDPARPVLLIGSCFTDSIGSRMRASMCPATVNPCGVQYNPESMAQLIESALGGALPAESIFFHDGLWRCWLMSSAFASPSRGEAEDKAYTALNSLGAALRRTETVIVTFGTAQAYVHLPSATSAFATVVGNCHKVPQREFSRTMLTVGSIVSRWSCIVDLVRAVNPDVRFIYTVSPVRHLSPSARLNTLSKATLHLAADELVAADRGRSAYFGAWELLIDDLRDYRFYAGDMTHPSAVAADYIWDAFRRCFYSEEHRRLLDEGAAIVRRATHRRLTADEAGDSTFRSETADMADRFMRAHPGLCMPDNLCES